MRDLIISFAYKINRFTREVRFFFFRKGALARVHYVSREYPFRFEFYTISGRLRRKENTDVFAFRHI